MEAFLLVVLVCCGLAVLMPNVFYFYLLPKARKEFKDFTASLRFPKKTPDKNRDEKSPNDESLDIGPIPERDERPHVLIVNHNTSWRHRWKDEDLEESLDRLGFRVTQIKASPEDLADLKKRSCLGHEFAKIILNGGSVSGVYDILEEFQSELTHT